MVMPGRNFTSASGYRYGFQGQEKDDEFKGAGNSINYKFRMHDPRIGRFLSIDPLARDYAHNSPYAFSENRVIDGVELEGLEYATYTILIINNKVSKIHVTKDYELKNENTQGPGIQYNRVFVDSEKNTVNTVTHFKQNLYGIYLGGENPQLPDIGGDPFVVHDDYSLEPITETDANAKQHDLDFDELNLKGFEGVMDPKSTKANEDFIKRADRTIEKYENGKNDATTGDRVTKNAKDAAKYSKLGFKAAEKVKQHTNRKDEE